MNKYCCDRFKDSVKNGYIEKTDHYDETKWFLKEWLHIYTIVHFVAEMLKVGALGAMM
jgi:hypothetical protein